MSPKHLSEFYMIEAEEAFLTSLDRLLDRVETLVKFAMYYIERHCHDDLRYLHDYNGYDLFDRISKSSFRR